MAQVFDNVSGVETLEHWWNGRATPEYRRDLVLRFNSAGPLWEIEVREAGRPRVVEFPDEPAARRRLQTALGPEWRQLTPEAAPSS